MPKPTVTKRPARSPGRAVLAVVGPILAFAFAHLADAEEGRIEINQTAALAGSITPGDDAGFPVEISTSGSYVLTSDLAVSSLQTTAILVTTTGGVTLDLNGFSITGACPPSTGCAAGAGTARGIDASGSTSFVVHDGRIRGFAGDGIRTNARARVTDVVVEGSGGDGIAVGGGSMVESSTAYDNSGAGISATEAIVRDCRSGANLDGITAGARSQVTGNLVYQNTRTGILVTGEGTSVLQNVVNLNAADGIAVTQSGALVAENVARANASAGIALLTSGSVQRNVSTGNALGLYLFPEAGGNPAGYRGNLVSGNPVASVTSGLSMGENACNGTTTCP